MRQSRAWVLMVVAGCYTQPVYTLNPREQCAQSTMVLDNGSVAAGDNGGLYGASSTVAPGENGGLYGATTRSAPGENGGLYGASSAAPGENGGLYGASGANGANGARCRRPATAADQCEIRSLQASADLKHKSNAGEVAPVSNDQVEYTRSSVYQNCMAGAAAGPSGPSGPPGATQVQQ
jgi:hypothetical protein